VYNYLKNPAKSWKIYNDTINFKRDISKKFISKTPLNQLTLNAMYTIDFYLRQGLSDMAIATKLHVNLRTVNAYRYNQEFYKKEKPAWIVKKKKK